jgi:DNA-directed RNA polymerase specialized sigma subunit
MKTIHANLPQRSEKLASEHRDRIDLLRERLHLLSGKDKLIMTMYLEKGSSFRQIAQLAGVNEAKIARRIRTVTRRLIEGQYITCLRNQHRFTERQMTIANDHFLRGLAIRQIAANRHISYYRVRRILKTIQEVLQTIRRQEQPQCRARAKRLPPVGGCQ